MDRSRRHRRRWVRSSVGAVAVVALAAVIVGAAELLEDRVEAASGHAIGLPHLHRPQTTLASLSAPLPQPATERLTFGASTRPTAEGGSARPSPASLLACTSRTPSTAPSSIIDPHTFKVVRTISVGGQPHHITPAWNLRHLYIDNPALDRPTSSTHARRRSPARCGSRAPTTCTSRRTERRPSWWPSTTTDRVQDPHTWRLMKRVSIPFRGVDHMDFSRNGRTCW